MITTTPFLCHFEHVSCADVQLCRFLQLWRSPEITKKIPLHSKLAWNLSVRTVILYDRRKTLVSTNLLAPTQTFRQKIPETISLSSPPELQVQLLCPPETWCPRYLFESPVYKFKSFMCNTMISMTIHFVVFRVDVTYLRNEERLGPKNVLPASTWSVNKLKMADETAREKWLRELEDFPW